MTKLMESCVSMDEVYEQMEKCRASQRVLLIDACRNERAVKGIKSLGLKGFTAEMEQDSKPLRGLRILSSCEAGQWSAEDPKLKHGVFMNYVIQGWRGKADLECEGNKNGRISLDELYAYAHQRTKTHVSKSHGILQRPWMKGEAVGIYEIGTVNLEASHALELTPDPKDIVETGASKQPTDPLSGQYRILAKRGIEFHDGGSYDKAIEEFTDIIKETSLPAEILNLARQDRAKAYLERRKEGDFKLAIADRKAAGGKEVLLSIRVASANLMIGKEVVNKVKQGQVVEITSESPPYLWVNSVGGDETFRGWVLKTAVLEQQPATARAPVATSTQVANTRNVDHQSQQSANHSSSYANKKFRGMSPEEWTRDFQRRKGRLPSAGETPWWEPARDLKRLRASGQLRSR